MEGEACVMVVASKGAATAGAASGGRRDHCLPCAHALVTGPFIRCQRSWEICNLLSSWPFLLLF